MCGNKSISKMLFFFKPQGLLFSQNICQFPCPSSQTLPHYQNCGVVAGLSKILSKNRGVENSQAFIRRVPCPRSRPLYFTLPAREICFVRSGLVAHALRNGYIEILMCESTAYPYRRDSTYTVPYVRRIAFCANAITNRNNYFNRGRHRRHGKKMARPCRAEKRKKNSLAARDAASRVLTACRSAPEADGSARQPRRACLRRICLQRLKLRGRLLPVGGVAVDLELERANLSVRLREVRRRRRVEELGARRVERLL